MANRAPTLALLGLIALLVAGGTWFALRATTDGAGLPEVGPAGAPPGAGDAARLEASPEREVERESEPGLATPAPPATGARENFDTENAIFVEVMIVRPPGTPADEALELIAFSAKDTDGTERLLDAEGLDLQLQRFAVPVASLVRQSLTDTTAERTFAVREVAGDRVRIPFAPEAGRGMLMLSGRYLYLEKAAPVDLAGGERAITLEPLLGAHVHGELRLPPTAAARGIGPETVTATVHAAGMDVGGRRAGQARQLRATYEVDGSQGPLEYEFNALPGDMTYFIVVDPDRVAADRRMGVPLPAGVSTRVDFDLALGVHMTGRVVDGDGAPIQGAAVYRIGLPSTFFTRSALTRTESGEDGRFELEGLEAGDVRIRAWKKGRISSEHGPVAAEDGSEHDAGDLVLGTGASLSGTVHWPDGRAAGGAEVRVLKAFEAESRHRLQTVSADADGAFTFSGLIEGPYEVVAALGPEGTTEGPGLWRAAVAGVVDTEAPVALVLVEPLGIAGVVRDDLGMPVTKFRVGARYAGEDAWGGYTYLADDFESDAGSFLLSGVYRGPHSVSITAPGHAASDGTPCTVPREGGPLEFVLPRTGEAQGVVLDPSGRPIKGAAVYARQGAAQPMMGWGSGADTVRTNERGEFRITALAPGAHAVGAGHLDWADSPELAVELEPGQLSAGLTLQLRIGATITGEVFDAQGFPMQGRRVAYSKTMLMGFGGGLDSTQTDAAGAFRFEHVSPGEWNVSASPGFAEQMETLKKVDENAMMNMMSRILTEKVTVADGEEAYVRLGSVPRVPVRLSGNITRGGLPIQTKLYAVAEGGALFSGLKACDSDERGDYEVVLDRPGPYVVGVDGAAGTVEFHADVPEAEAYEFHIALPTGAIRGTVFGPDGEPEPEVRVSLFEQSGIARLARLDGTTRRANADGTFEFVDLRAGTYVLRAGAGGNFSRDPDRAYGAIVSLPYELEEDGVLDGIELHLEDAGRIEGSVRDADGTPVAEAGVYIRNERGELLSPFPRAKTDAAGRFTYRNVAPGNVTVSARSGDRTAADSEPVSVRAGEASEIELTLEAATILVITVQDGEGEDVRAAISVTDSAGREMSGMLSPDFFEDAVTEGVSTREHRVGPLAPGRFTVVATAEDGRSRKKRVTVRGKPETRVRIKLADDRR